MTPLAATLENKAQRYYHFFLLILGADLILNFYFTSSFNNGFPDMVFVTIFVILEFVLLAGILYCLSTRNQCLKDLKEENAKTLSS